MQLISGPVVAVDSSLTEVVLSVERLVLAKRRWRATAIDGADFGFELEKPLKHGEVFWQQNGARYVVRQQPEAVVEILLDIAPSAAAGIGWAVGNLHLELAAESNRLLAPDEPAVRALLERLNVTFRPATAIFRPGRFARGAQVTHELGVSHQH